MDGGFAHDGVARVAEEFSGSFAEGAFHALEGFDWVDGVELEVEFEDGGEV